MAPTRVHLTFVFEESDVPEIAALRHRFDPGMAATVPPHTTLAYPEEFGDERELLLARAAALGDEFGRFSLKCAEVVTDGDDGAGGVFVALTDPSGTWNALRARLLTSPLTALPIEPHMTVVHPRTSDRGRKAWKELRGWRCGQIVAPSEFVLSETDTTNGLRVLERFPLRARARPLCSAVLPVDNGRVLLGKRTADRSWFPDVWDVIGGHVENGESITTAAVREVAEEVGVDIAEDDIRHVHTKVADDYELVVFATNTWSGTPINKAPAEHAEIAWFTPDQMAQLDLADPEIATIAAAAVTDAG